MEDQDQDIFALLPYQTIIRMITPLLYQEDSIEQDRLLNICNFKLINCVFMVLPENKNLSLMNTRLWLRILSSMGYDGQSNTFIPENRTFTWDNSIIEYQRNVINQFLYTSRVHDLIDCLRREGNHIARFLLIRLAQQTHDNNERMFLMGRTPPAIRLDNIRLRQWLAAPHLHVAIKYWDVRDVTDMTNLFSGCPERNFDLRYWDVSKVTNMSGMFNECDNKTFTGLANWNTCRVTNMSRIANYIFNSDISNWDVSSVNDMSDMFSEAYAFNQDIGGWDTRRVTNMEGMFSEAYSFNQDIGEWDTRRVATMRGMFFRARDFNQDIGRWVTSRVTNMGQMFCEARYFNQDIGEWDTRRVINMSNMFNNAISFNQALRWNTSQVVNMHMMFMGARSFNQVLDWDINNVINNVHIINMFTGSNGRFTENRIEMRRRRLRRARLIAENVGRLVPSDSFASDASTP